MTTKTQYALYLSSEKWRNRRKQFLEEYVCDCSRCGLPRWLMIVAYDQDVHLHHKNYQHVGAELDEDLEPLCRRCHEVETFGKSKLHIPRAADCIQCGQATWDVAERLCDLCRSGGGDVESRELLRRIEMFEERADRLHGEEMDRLQQIKQDYDEQLKLEHSYEERRQVAREREMNEESFR